MKWSISTLKRRWKAPRRKKRHPLSRPHLSPKWCRPNRPYSVVHARRGRRVSIGGAVAKHMFSGTADNWPQMPLKIKQTVHGKPSRTGVVAENLAIKVCRQNFRRFAVRAYTPYYAGFGINAIHHPAGTIEPATTVQQCGAIKCVHMEH